jgi:glycosyltransferase involved in cell wall biosynthesis
MKGIYLSNLDPIKAKGYDTKILGQIQGFNQLGIDISFIGLATDNQIIFKNYSALTRSLVEEKTLRTFRNNLISKRINLYRSATDAIAKIAPDFLYLRHPRSDPLYLYFLRSVKKISSQIVIISEIPTYPYDQEYLNCKKVKNKLLICLDKITRNKLKQYIDYIVVVTYEGFVLGIPSINITNGINVNYVNVIDRPTLIGQELQLIGVGNIDFWHGYDRVIYGLKNYYQNSQKQNPITIKFNIVSPLTQTVKALQALTNKFNLSNYIIFHGIQDGIELNQIFAQSHLAVGDLGSHRKGLEKTAALKVREYTARGIPFITSAEDPDFSSDFPYIFKAPPNEEAINIEQVIDFAKEVYRDENHSYKMREYAAKNLDWSIKLKPVIEVIKHLPYSAK